MFGQRCPQISFQGLQFCKLRAQLHSEFLFAADLPILDASFAFTCGLACTPSVFGNRVCVAMVAEVEASAQGSLGRRGDRAAVVRCCCAAAAALLRCCCANASRQCFWRGFHPLANTIRVPSCSEADSQQVHTQRRCPAVPVLLRASLGYTTPLKSSTTPVGIAESLSLIHI